MHTSPAYELSDNLNIDFYPIYRDQFLLAAKKGHPLGKYAAESGNSDYSKIDIRLFEKEPFIMLSRWQRIRQVSDMILQRAGIIPNVAFTTKSYETARRLAREGLGVTFVPEQYLRIFPEINEQDYYSVDEALEPYWDLCVAVQKNVYIPKAAQAFIRMVNDKYGSAPLALVNDNPIK
jgi:DNA-binding transcriptional LysR family regulator